VTTYLTSDNSCTAVLLLRRNTSAFSPDAQNQLHAHFYDSVRVHTDINFTATMLAIIFPKSEDQVRAQNQTFETLYLTQRRRLEKFCSIRNVISWVPADITIKCGKNEIYFGKLQYATCMTEH